MQVHHGSNQAENVHCSPETHDHSAEETIESEWPSICEDYAKASDLRTSQKGHQWNSLALKQQEVLIDWQRSWVYNWQQRLNCCDEKQAGKLRWIAVRVKEPSNQTWSFPSFIWAEHVTSYSAFNRIFTHASIENVCSASHFWLPVDSWQAEYLCICQRLCKSKLQFLVDRTIQNAWSHLLCFPLSNTTNLLRFCGETAETDQANIFPWRLFFLLVDELQTLVRWNKSCRYPLVDKAIPFSGKKQASFTWALEEVSENCKVIMWNLIWAYFHVYPIHTLNIPKRFQIQTSIYFLINVSKVEWRAESCRKHICSLISWLRFDECKVNYTPIRRRKLLCQLRTGDALLTKQSFDQKTRVFNPICGFTSKFFVFSRIGR